MKKRFNTFGLLNFVIILVFLFRQLYYFNLISSFVVSTNIVYGLLFFALAITVASLAVFILYYIPSLIVIEVVLNIEFKHITLPKVEWVNNIVTQYTCNKSNTYKRLQVIRC
ncbi:MAG: hypothetical protein K9L64_04180 [Candidatus Izimaplasma sp.]|nr:hypothetical protein [Candidatus Izimaplasma bacterium]